MRKLQSTRLFALVACFAALPAVVIRSQTHHVDAPENVTRSVGVYEWTGDLAKPTAARLVPVSIFIEGTYQDGGTYYSRPIPLALLNGNIYSLEKAGLPQGTLTLDYARHLQAAAAGAEDSTNLGWFGYGTFAPLVAERKTKALHASSSTPTIVSSKDKDADSKDNDRPTFGKKTGDTAKTTTASKSSDRSETTVTAIGNPAEDDPDRPHLSKAPSATASPAADPSTPSTTPSTTPSSPAPASSTASSSRTNDHTVDPADDTDRPTLRHRDPKQAEADRKARSRSTVTATPGSLNDDPDRPNMRRGATAGVGGAPATQLTGIPAGLHQLVAVSDPVNRDPHPFAREWATPSERGEILSKVQSIAQQQLAAYARTNSPDRPIQAPATAAKPAARANPHHRPTPNAVASPSVPLTNEECTGYTLSYGGLPTFVYSGTAPGALLPSAASERYVTLVAQQLPSGELQLAFSSVTDAAHLDRTPWFRLVDAVDPDAAHRASLLFELRGHSSRQFALYRILSAKADQLFLTNPTD